MPEYATSLVKSEDLEAAMLNRLINDRYAPLQVMHLLRDDYFEDPTHHAIFKAISELYNSGIEISMTSVAEQLRNTLSAERATHIVSITAERIFGGDEYYDAIPMALRLQEYSQRRKLIEVERKIRMLTSDMTYNLKQGTTEVMRLFEQIVTGGAQDAVVSLTEVLDEVSQIADDNQSPDTQHLGVLCGLPEIDNLGGLPDNGLVIIGAKTSHGKTTFAINVAVYALLQGHRIACFSIEMTRQRVAGRIVSMRSGVNSNAIMRLPLPPDELQRTHEAISELQQTVAGNFYFDNRNTHDVNGLLLMIRSMNRTRGIDVVVIDYAQLIDASPGEECDNENKLLSDLSHKLHALAQELGVCIMLLSQVNRSMPGMPNIAALRGSGAIGEAADMVILLYNAFHDKADFPAPFQGIDTRDKLYGEVAKSRDGARPSFLMNFLPDLTLISPYIALPAEAAPVRTPEQKVLDLFRKQVSPHSSLLTPNS